MKNFLASPCSALLGSLSLAALSLAFSAPAEAVVIANVGGTNYEVTTFNGTYDANISRFSVNEMPWWGNKALAESFATALWTIAPLPNGGLPGNDSVGPFFAWQEDANVSFVAAGINGGGLLSATTSSSIAFNYAVAQAVPVPFESDALPVVGATLFMAGGLWWKKKRNQTKDKLDSLNTDKFT